MPQCLCDNLTTAKVLLREISVPSPFILSRAWPLVLSLPASALLVDVAQPGFPLLCRWQDGCLLSSCSTNCLPIRCRQSLPPAQGGRHFPAAPRQAVANQLSQAKESSLLLVAQRLCFLLSSAAGSRPLYVSLGKWSLWLDRCTEQGHRKEMGHEGVAGDSNIWWDTVQSHHQQQNVCQPLGTDLYYKYNVFPCNVKPESKAST